MVYDYLSYLYKDEDGWYILEDQYGEELAANNNAPETLLKSGLDRKGTFKVRGAGNWDCSSNLSTLGGLNLMRHTVLDVGVDVIFRVPNGYNKDFLKVDYTYETATVLNSAIKGILNIEEQGTAQFLWNGMTLNLPDPGSPASRGITCCDFGNMNITNARSAIKIDLKHSGGWLTSCYFGIVKSFYCVNAIEFVNTAGITSGVPGISSNTFDHIWHQSGAKTEYGVKDVMGKNLTFKDTAIWDLQTSYDSQPDGIFGDGHSASFTPYCKDIFVEAGIMMYYNLVNNAPKGAVKFYDSYTTNIAENWQYYDDPTGFSTDGDGIQKTFTFTHGLNWTPKRVDVRPDSDDAFVSPIKWTHDATNVYVTFMGLAPKKATPGNTGNVKFKVRYSNN